MSSSVTAASTTSNNTKRNPFRWVMLLFICLFYFTILGFTNQSFNILLATISGDLGWTPTQRAAVATAMSSGMIWFVFVAGTLLDRFSVKKILGSAVLICAVLIYLRGDAQGFIFFFTIMFLFGVASAFYMPACTKVIGLWFDREELAVANGFLTAASPLGQITANLFAVQIMYKVGSWQTFYSIIGICVAIIVAFFFFIGKDRKSAEAALTSSVIKAEDLQIWKNIVGILKVPTVWLYCLANLCFLGAIYAGGAWGQFVLQTDTGWMLDKAISGRIPAFNNCASMIFYILMPLIIAKVGNKYFRHFAIVCGIIAPICFIIGYRSYDFTTLAVMMVISGICYGAIVPASKVLMLKLQEVAGPRAGTALGVYVTIERIGITIFTGYLGALMVNPENMSVILSNFYAIQLIAPLLIFIAGIMEKRREKALTTSE